MNSKAIKRQLLAAIAMVLVAAIALGSSTYAWFVQSGSVTAKGMKVNVQSEGGLVIRYAGGESTDAWGVSATANMSDYKTLVPTSTNMKMETWTTGDALSATNYAMDADTYKSVDDLVYDQGNFKDNQYVAMKKFQIRSSNPSAECKGLYVESVTVSATYTLSTALRVGIKYTVPGDNGNTTGSFIMAPVTVAGDGATTVPTYTYKFIPVTDGVLGTPENVTAVTVEKANTTIVADGATVSSSADNAVSVDIYIWFEGQDEHLYSDNILGTDNLDISVVFTSDSIKA